MTDLFKGIPEERIELILHNIETNLNKISVYEGHVIKKHVDIQLYVLQVRLTKEDIRFATSFYSLKVAQMVATSLLIQFYDSKIKEWLLCPCCDRLTIMARCQRGVGYGYKKSDSQNLYENLDKICLVLEKEEEHEWGFRILTFYPVF